MTNAVAIGLPGRDAHDDLPDEAINLSLVYGVPTADWSWQEALLEGKKRKNQRAAQLVTTLVQEMKDSSQQVTSWSTQILLHFNQRGHIVDFPSAQGGSSSE